MKRLFFGGLTTIIIFLSCIPVEPRPQSTRRFREEFLDRINEARHKGCNCGNTFYPPAPPLVWNNQLEVAAKGHAEDMSDRSYFSHTSKDGRTMADRITAAGYAFKGFSSYTVGENIAQGQMTIAGVMDGWLQSEGHCKNLMNPAFKEVGVAEINYYWVQDFGGRESFTPEQEKLIKSGRYKVIQKQVQEGH
jgi:uncharacterized protein YkwD